MSASPTSTEVSPSSTQSALAMISASLAAIKQQESALASASASALGKAPPNSTPASYKIIGIILALVSGLFIGSSFVFKKKGLLNSQQKVLEKGGEAGEGHAYLKSPMWWSGMTLMILGEICNFVAYAFADAILVTPMGALSVVISAILSSIFLKERLSFFGKIGCFLCIVGATVIALNAPEEQAASTIPEFQKLFLAPGFLVFGSIVILGALALIFFAAPKYGKSNMMVYISICSIIGGLSVVCTQGLGASIITSIKGDSQFKYWFMYFLIGFVICTLLTEINYLNKALELFNTAMVTPTYYVMFTFSTLLTSIILFQGLKAQVTDIITLVLGFLVICSGITLLQMSKIDPKDLPVDEKSAVFLSVDKEFDNESGLAAEEPGVDGLRGFGGLIGSIHRNSLIARQSNASSLAALHERNMRRRHAAGAGSLNSRTPSTVGSPVVGLRKHGLWDRPMDDRTHSRSGSKDQEFVNDDFKLNVFNKHSTSSAERSNSISSFNPSLTSSLAGNHPTSERSKSTKMSSTEGISSRQVSTYAVPNPNYGQYLDPYETNPLEVRTNATTIGQLPMDEDFGRGLGNRWTAGPSNPNHPRGPDSMGRMTSYGSQAEMPGKKPTQEQVLNNRDITSSPTSYRSGDPGIVNIYRKKSYKDPPFIQPHHQGVGAMMRKSFRSGTGGIVGGNGIGGGGGGGNGGDSDEQKSSEMQSLVRARSSSSSSSTFSNRSSTEKVMSKNDYHKRRLRSKSRTKKDHNHNNRGGGGDNVLKKRGVNNERAEIIEHKEEEDDEDEDEDMMTGRVGALMSHD